MSQASDFNTAYIASKERLIRNLFAGTMGQSGPMLDFEDRYSQALTLAKSGRLIDPQIDVDGGNPFGVMQERQNYGFQTVPALLQKLPSVFLPPGVNVPGVPLYDPSLWLIKVTTNISDLIPFVDPEPATNYVGLYAGNGLYNVINGAEKIFVADQAYSEGGLNFTFFPAGPINEFFWKFVSKG